MIGVAVGIPYIPVSVGGSGVPANAMLWPDGPAMQWPDGEYMFWPSAPTTVPNISVAVNGNIVTITNTGGQDATFDYGDGTTGTSLTHGYATQGVYAVTSSNAAGDGNTVTAIVSSFWATGRTT